MSLPAGATNARRVGGGDINEAWRVTLADGREAFVKTRPDAGPQEYATEARGLRWLAEPGALRTPQVLEAADNHLVLEWVQPGSLSVEGADELGRGLALTHAAGAPAFGGEADGGFGSLRLPNDPTPDWCAFYAQRRLLPLAEIARERGALSERGAHAVEAVCERLAELAGPPEPPARLHGDLWSGNAMADADGRPWLIDPSAYGGHREIDLAMLRLFGGRAGPGSRLFAAYAETAPLAEGWEDRVELWQLLPLLVHAVLFGGGYVGAAERVARRYAG
ncbi:MAG TPA: fructosamine kinase family protein [Solirubrobacteraceae bacterium]|jgi:fructosamine-3-kinase|nr:fructosamine kinase family protein [Solirubrobacteraceae bacterium]